MEFSGSEGAVSALRWLEKTKAMLAISKCMEEDKVLYACNLFLNKALEWWNTIRQIKGNEKMSQMNWTDFKELVIRKFCPIHEKEQAQARFLNHRMMGVDCKTYMKFFFEYALLVPHLATPESELITRYIWGLASEIRDVLKPHFQNLSILRWR